MLDVEATIRATAAAGRMLPILQPGAERRFSADLVFDVSPSMLPWDGAFAELVGIFAHVGAFREIRPWRLHVDGDDVSLADRFERRWRPGTLRTTDRRRVVIIVTDAVAEHWYQPALWRHIADWGSTGIVALIDPLPLKLWNFSGIGPNRVRVQATDAAAPNAELSYKIPRRRRLTGRSAGASAIPVPVMELSPTALAQWSAMVAAAHPAENAALLVESGAPVGAAGPPRREPDGQASLTNFLHTASPEALRLVVLAATVDSTTLAVLRAIQQELLPESAISDLAEVLVSGIFQHLPDSNGPDLRIRMNADCRAELQAFASPQDRWDVYRAVTAAIQRASPESARSFQAAVLDLQGNTTVREDQRAFAEIARSALAQVGDALADLVPNLAAEHRPAGPSTGKRATTARGGMRIVLVGPPGAGKGTQAQFISSHLAIPRISTADIFRYNVTQHTPLGRQAREYMERGDLVPDEVTVAMVRDRLAEDDAQEGFLLDGFPRNVPQAKTLKKMLSEWDAKLSVVLELVVDEDEVVRRLSGRRTCRRCERVWHVLYDPPARDGICDDCGGELFQRDDDSEETIRHRLEVYAEQTSPLIAFYADEHLLIGIDATGPVEEITSRALAALRPFVR
jgi:adenylate kinase